MDFLQQVATGKILLLDQDTAKLQQLLIPNSILKAKVISLLGDKALLSILGEKVFAEAPSVPLAAGQVLQVQVKKEGETLQLKIISSTPSPSGPLRGPTDLSNDFKEQSQEILSNYLKSAGLPLSQKTRALAQLFLNLKIPADSETLKSAQALLSEKPSFDELRSVALLKLSGLPLKQETFQLLKTFFEGQSRQQIPLSKGEELPVLQGKIQNIVNLSQPETPESRAPLGTDSISDGLSHLLQTVLVSPEKRLLAVWEGFKKLEGLLVELQEMPKAELAKETQTISSLLQAIKENLSPSHPASLLAAKAEAVLKDIADSRKGVADPRQGVADPRQGGAAQAGKPAASPQQAGLQQDKSAAAPRSETQAASLQPEKSIPEPRLILTAVKNALQEIHENLQALQPQLQNVGKPLQSFLESHQAGNALLARQDPPLVSIPIPMTLNGKNWVGYLHVQGEPNKKSFEQNLKDGTFTLKFTVQTEHLGPVEAKFRSQENVLDGTFQVKGGEEKQFIEQNTDKLLKRLESLPFKVRSIQARIGEDAKTGMGWIPVHISGTFDVRV